LTRPIHSGPRKTMGNGGGKNRCLVDSTKETAIGGQKRTRTKGPSKKKKDSTSRTTHQAITPGKRRRKGPERRTTVRGGKLLGKS